MGKLQEFVQEQQEEQIISKKERKLQKKLLKQVEHLEKEQQIEEYNENSQEDIQQDNERQKKKKSKKEKKNQQNSLQQENEVNEENQDEIEPSIIKKIKQKKEKIFNLKRVLKLQDDFTKEKVENWREQYQMIVSGQGAEDIKPIRNFEESGFNSQLLSCLSQFQTPTPIQSQVWPILLQDHDCIAIAETGSGKTFGFLMPALVHILKKQKTLNEQQFNLPQVIVLSPTRELATQIAEVCQQAGQILGISSVCVYGGVSKKEQKQQIRQGAQVIIGTPGRMMDLIQDRSINCKYISMMVLDEADRMLDQGFEEQIKGIFAEVSNERQTMMFSATWPVKVQKIAEQYINKNPITIKIGQNDDATANKRVTQWVDVIEDRQKDPKLIELLNKYHSSRKNRVIVFVLYKKEAERVENNLIRRGWSCVSIHGDKSQVQRNQAFEQFKSGEVPLLIATDVAARGLDIPNVEYVINYTFPLTIQDYVHRIGRTGRAGKFGVAHTLFTVNEKGLAGALCDVLKEAGQKVSPELEKFGPTIEKQKEHSMYGFHFKQHDPSMPQATKKKLI